MKLLDEVIENPFDLDRFIKFAGLVFIGLEQPSPGQSMSEQSSPGRFVPGQPNTALPLSGFRTEPAGIPFIRIFKCSDGAKIAVLAIRSENTVYGYRKGMVLEILASTHCEAAVAAFYEDNVPEWKLSYIKLMQNGRPEDEISAGNCGIKRISFTMGTGGRLEAADLTGIVADAAGRQLLRLLQRKGQIALRDIEKAFSYNVFTRNVIRAFNRRYPDVANISDILKLPGFKMRESGPYDRDLAIDPEMLGNIFESRFKKRDRKNRGAFYTPSETVSFMCRESLAQYISNAADLSYGDCRKYLGLEGPVHGIEGLIPAEGRMPVELVPGLSGTAAESLGKIDRVLRQVRIFDPAAGSGAFVLGMLKEIVRMRNAVSISISAGSTENRAVESQAYSLEARLGESVGKHIYELMLHTVGNCIFAADIDEEAVRLTRLRLQCALASAVDGMQADPGRFCHVACGDSLGDSADIFKKDPAFASVISEKGGFDIVIGNPPYISAVEGARHGNPLRDSLKSKYSILKGSFDIYTAFLLEGVRQTNEDGVYCWIVPNSLLSSRYAQPVLEFLRQHGLNRTISVSDIDIFHNVGVYPVIAIGNKKVQVAGYTGYIAASTDNPGCAAVKNSSGTVGYGTFKDYGIRIASGAAGFQARALAGCISEEDNELAIPFVVSGSIDRYSTSFLNVRYMGKTWPKAYITKSGDIAQSKWKLWCGEKIIIAGLTRELEADYSREPLALGVGAYAIYGFGNFDPLYLLGLLNSRFMSKYLRDRFYEKHLAGGYLAINKATLEQLPLMPADPATQKTVAEKVSAVKALMRQPQAEKTPQMKMQCENLLSEIDELVERLYA